MDKRPEPPSIVDRAETADRLRVPSAPGEKQRLRHLRRLGIGMALLSFSALIYLWLLLA